MILEEIKKIINLTFDKDSNSLFIAIIINDFMGGKIMKYKENNKIIYYNIVKDNIIDLENNINDTKTSEEVSKESLLSNKDIKTLYLKYLKEIKNNFLKYGNKEYKLRNSQNKEYTSKIPGTLGGHKKLKIYGKLNCPSALNYIKKGQYISERVFFLDEETAKKAGYRPCAKCMKKEYIKWKNKK